MKEFQDLSDILKRIGDGTADSDAGRAIREVVAACLETDKRGKVTITVDVVPDLNISDAVILSAAVKSAPPRVTAPKSRFYATPGGGLTRHDPEQMTLYVETP